MNLTKKLSKEEQAEILEPLFGFSFDGIVLLDDDGEEFYGCQHNCQFDFSTLAGIFSYMAYKSKNSGYEDAKREIRKALGL